MYIFELLSFLRCKPFSYHLCGFFRTVQYVVRFQYKTTTGIGIPLPIGGLIFLVWGGVLALVIILKDVAEIENDYLEIFETMYRIGSIIFGGGQVVLPMLQDEVVPHWMTNDQFLQGLGLAQSMPGPLFNFSA